MTSKEELIATLQPNLGYLKHVETNPTNTACVFLTEDAGNIERYIFQDKVYESDYYIPAFSLSFDGKKLAIISPESDKIGKGVILINGEVKYNTGLDTVYRLQWLSNDELAWYGWNESEDRNERTKDHGYFINGQDMTDRFEFECFYGGSVMVKMDNLVYCIDKNGNRSQSKVANGDRWNNWGFSDQTEKMERSKRYYPVIGNQIWEKGYHGIDDYLLTPTGKMVVVANEGKKAFVAIDEEKVSSDYNSVYHCVFLDDEGVCFIGRKDNNFFRVVV